MEKLYKFVFWLDHVDRGHDGGWRGAGQSVATW